MITIITLALLVALQSPSADSGMSSLEKRRLDALFELAEAKWYRAQIENSLSRLLRPDFDAAKDQTLKRLNGQLTASEAALSEIRANADSSGLNLRLAEARQKHLAQKVSLASKDLRTYFEQELADANQLEIEIKQRLKVIQNELDSPVSLPPVVVVRQPDIQPILTNIFVSPPPAAPNTRPNPTASTLPTSGNSLESLTGRDVVSGPKDELLYRLIKPGKFQMGCLEGDRCDADETAHSVVLTKAFWIGKIEVPAGTYAKFAEETGRPMPKPPLDNGSWNNVAGPINRVTYQDAADYCKWAQGRLPSEAEWEYAARGGSSTVYSWGNAPDPDRARYSGNDKAKELRHRFKNSGPVAGGSFPVNSWGLADMIGNVSEWVADYYSSYPSETVTDPKGPSDGKFRIARGGSFASDPKQLRLAKREKLGPLDSANRIGFRCVLDSPLAVPASK